MAGRFSVEAVFKAVDRVTAPVSRMQQRLGKFTRSVERGMRSATRAISGMNARLRSVAGSLLRVGGAAVVGGITAVTLALNNQADAADALAKRSRRLQFPIEELQEWQFVAEQSGIASETFDKSLEKFTKTVGEAKAGTGTLITVLKKANPALLAQLNATDSVSDAFDLYLGALRETEDQTVKTALATAAFGRTGAQFLNITEQSTDAIAALRKEQRQNGVITKQQAEQAEAYNDAVNSLQRSLKGLLADVILPLTPALTRVARQWREWIVANREMLQLKISQFFSDAKDRVVSMARAVAEFSRQNNLADMFFGALDAATSFFAFIRENERTLRQLAGAYILVNVAIKLVTVSTMALRGAMMLLGGTIAVVKGAGVAFALIAGALPKVLAAARVAMLALNLAMVANPIGLVVAAVAGLIAAGALLVTAWEPVKAFFADLWATIKESAAGIFKLAGKFANVFGFSTPEAPAATGVTGTVERRVLPREAANDNDVPAFAPQVSSPQERVARSIEERSNTSSAEVTIRDETGRAEMTKNNTDGAVTLQASGAL